MADIRINSLPTTATSSASDDFIAIDGSANGTRKLSVYSPTFGGVVTVSAPTDGQLILSQNSATTASRRLRVTNTEASGATYDLELQSVSSGNKLRWALQGSSATLESLDTSGNKVLAGNLTVSGTGTSSVGGPFTFNQTIYGVAGTFTYSGLTLPHYGISWQDLSGGLIGPSALVSGYGGIRFFTSGAFAAMFANGTNNLLLGTTIDGGQRLQVNGAIAVNPGGTSTALVLKSSQSGAYGWQFIQDEASTGNFFLQRIVASTASDVLTLDRSSGNATFAGQTLKVSPSANDGAVNVLGRATGTNQVAASSRGATLSVTNLNNTDNNCEAVAFQNSNELAIASIVAQNVSHSGRTGKLYFNISNGAAPAEAFNIAADKTATFSGAIAIGNTVTSAASVASTHKVTISIGGVTYYLLASNV